MTILLGSVGVVFAKLPGAAVKNENANPNACWGMDRAYYASVKFFGDNMDIKQSFPGDVGEERALWVATYCDPHGPVPEVCVPSVVDNGEPHAGLYGSTVQLVTITHEDCSTIDAIKVTAPAFYYGPGGWGGWSCIESGYPDAIGGGYIPNTSTPLAFGIAEPGSEVGGYTYPTWPHYSFPSGEEGYVVQGAGAGNPSNVYVVCGPVL